MGGGAAGRYQATTSSPDFLIHCGTEALRREWSFKERGNDVANTTECEAVQYQFLMDGLATQLTLQETLPVLKQNCICMFEPISLHGALFDLITRTKILKVLSFIRAASDDNNLSVWLNEIPETIDPQILDSTELWHLFYKLPQLGQQVMKVARAVAKGQEEDDLFMSEFESNVSQGIRKCFSILEESKSDPVICLETVTMVNRRWRMCNAWVTEHHEQVKGVYVAREGDSGITGVAKVGCSCGRSVVAVFTCREMLFDF